MPPVVVSALKPLESRHYSAPVYTSATMMALVRYAQIRHMYQQEKFLDTGQHQAA
jgi:hypothetical protein